MTPVAILCAQARSVYGQVEGVEIYDEQRDAFTFTGGMPCVAHPPCRLFGKLPHFAKPDDAEAERFLGVWCADQVRRNGGVLEHPFNSSLWTLAGLPQRGQSDADGFTIALPQWWFGHRADKLTWFFFAGIDRADLPEIPFRLDSQDRRQVENLSHRQRAETPLALAAWLVESARRCSVLSV